MLYILWGEDEFSMNEALQAIKSKLGDLSMLSTNTNVFEGQKLTVGELKMVGEAMPFLSEKRLLIVKGLLGRFEESDKSSKTKKGASKQDEAMQFAECIKKFPDSTVLVLMDTLEVKTKTLKNNPLFTAISPRAEVKPFPVLKATKLSQWVQSRVSTYSCSISRQATDLLMGIIGGDLHKMSNEIAKLVAFTGGRAINEDDVRSVVTDAQEADIFAMMDAIMDHKATSAEMILQKLLQYGVFPSQMLVLLARQVQTLVLLKELRAQKRPISEIQMKLGIFNEFVWNKVYQRSDKYTFETLKHIYQKILDADLSIKTGKMDGELALNILVAELSSTPA